MTLETFIFSNPDRFGDWRVVNAESLEKARRRLTPAQRRRLTSERMFTPTSRHRAGLEAHEDTPIPGARRRRTAR